MPQHSLSTTMKRCWKLETCTESPTTSDSVKVLRSSGNIGKREITLPDEIVYEILINLPVEQLQNCMSVCKSWNFMIKSSHFILSHLELKLLTKSKNTRDMNEKDDLLLVRSQNTRSYEAGEIFTLDCDNVNNEYTKSPRVISMSGIRTAVSSIYGTREFKMEHLNTHGSCNGLICIDDMHDKIPTLWNPSIRRIFVLPRPSLLNEFENHYLLGYDSHNKDFKVLHISQQMRGGSSRFEVFSLRGSSWKDLNAPKNVKFWYVTASEIFGAFHWPCLELLPNSKKKYTALISFNLSTESFKQMVIPNKVRKRKPFHCLVVNYRGSFGLLSHGKMDWIYDLWVMNEYGVEESWTKVMKIQSADFCLGHPVYFRKNGEIMHGCGRVEIFDCKRKFVKTILYFSYGISLMKPFFASLALLDRADAFSY